MSQFDDVTVNGELRIQGLAPFRKLAACFFFGDSVSAQFISNEGFSPAFVRNGPGDYSLTLLEDPGPLIVAGAAYLAIDGVPGCLTLVPGPGSVRALMTHLDGTFVDNAFTIMLAANSLIV